MAKYRKVYRPPDAALFPFDRQIKIEFMVEVDGSIKNISIINGID